MPTIDQLDPAQAMADADLLPISQNGAARHASRAQLLATSQPLLTLSQGQLLGRASTGIGGPEPITFGANLALVGNTLSASTSPLLNEALPIEAFGARGDGLTDDSAALAAAIASGRPVRLSAKTYIVNGQFTIATANTALIGTPGLTTLKRHTQSGNGAWLSIQAPNFSADGIVFDANRAAVTQDSWGVLVTSACPQSDFHRCAFRNASGASLGSGLVFLASDPAISAHVVRDCEFSGNTVHGIWVQAVNGFQLSDSRAHDNGQYGICIDYNDASFYQKARAVQVQGCAAWANVRGIAIGNFNATNTQPPVWGNANPDAIGIVVAGNSCHDNTAYGITASGRALSIHGNMLVNNGLAPGGAGILANVSYSRVANNIVTGASTYGIDCGGSINSDISYNFVDGPVIGLNVGGSADVRVSGNDVQNCAQWAILVANVETDSYGQNFGIACNSLTLADNWIAMPSATAGGISLRDGPTNVAVARNNFFGGTLGLCLWPNTDSVVIEGNRWNLAPRFICNPITANGVQMVVFPDIADTIMLTAVTAPVQSMVSSYQAAILGQVSFVRVTAGGSGYTNATVAIGGPGTGATAKAVISNGVIIGIVVGGTGTGYGAIGAALPVTINGDGTGAAATAYAAPPVPEERALLVRCNLAVTFARVGSSPAQENWLATDLAVPVNGDVQWRGTWGTWRASSFPH